MKKSILNQLLFAIVLTLTIASCKKGTPVINLPLSGPDQEFYVLSDNNLKRFNANNIKTALSTVTITGLGTSENVMSIDFRPATGELYGVTDASKIYVINATSGVARAVSATAFTPAISGTSVSLDFNPTVDRIRLVSSTGQNLRLNPENGMVVAIDGSINGVTGAVVSGVAYTNNTAGTTVTALFEIDLTTKKLYKQDPPNNGTLVEIGSLGADFSGTTAAMDISPDNANVLAVGSTTSSSKLFTINTTTGAAVLAGNFPAGVIVKGIAIAANPVAYAVDNANNFLIFNPKSTAAPISKAITGLQVGETVVGIDMRPFNGQIFALGSTSRLYSVNASDGTFTRVGTLPFLTLLIGTSFGFDFNPTEDKIRVVSNTGQNLRLNPNDGAISMIDGNLSPGNPAVSAAAYTNNFAGATTTKLYVIDHITDKLYLQDANAGILAEVGALTVNVESTNGFDIISTGTTDTGYAIFTVGGVNKLYQINLATGVATAMGDFNNTVTAFTLGLRF